MILTGGNLAGEFLPTPSTRRATQGSCRCSPFLPISTHALHEEGDRKVLSAVLEFRVFLPTPSTRRATGTISDTADDFSISTHALHEEGDPGPLRPRHPWQISTPARHGEGDSRAARTSLYPPRFLPTPSTRRATRLRMAAWLHSSNFYPRPPRGGRRGSNMSGNNTQMDFYPRPPRGGRPYAGQPVGDGSPISTHALHEEGDSKCDGKTSILPLTFVH